MIRTRAEVVGNHAFFLVEDPMAGCKNVYTVYKARLSGDKGAEVIGRELPLSVARKTIRKHVERL